MDGVQCCEGLLIDGRGLYIGVKDLPKKMTTLTPPISRGFQIAPEPARPPPFASLAELY